MLADEQTLHRVTRHLNEERGKYIALLENLRTFFKSYSRSRDGAGHIYHVYSRGAKQDDEEFKDIRKIAQKLTPTMSIYDIPDIVGITVVTPFSKDYQIVLQLIESKSFKKEFNIKYSVTHDSAYQAKHYVVSKKTEMVRCEIQVKTAFHDAWTIKSHDLIYKEEGIFDQRFSTHMATLSMILSALEKQSDIIKEMVEESIYVDREKKANARREIANNLAGTLAGAPEDEHHNALRVLQDRAVKNVSKYVGADIKSKLIEEFKRDVEKIGNKYGYGVDLCRIAAAVAVSRPRTDLLHWTLTAIDQWKAAVEDVKPYPTHCPFHFASLILYACGEIDRAIIEDESGIRKQSARMGKSPQVGMAWSWGGAAHYYAELGINPKRGNPTDAEARAKAEEYIIKALELVPVSHPNYPALVDTHGFVKIAFATDETAVEEGIELCRTSWVALRGTSQESVSDLFYKLHKRLGFRKLLAFGEL